jgi:hypothetical protein
VGANDGFHSTVTMNWDGTAWTIVPSPNGGMFGDDNVLTSVTAISPNDMWSVGYIYPKGGTPVTLTIHWNGSQWSLVPSPNPGNYSRDLDGVAALASNDVWAVGSYSPDSGTTYLPLFLHWNGTQWLHVQAQEFPDYSVLRDVHAIAPNDIWAVGTNATCNFCPFDTLTMHWDGTAWTRVPSPNGNRDFSRLYGVTATSPGDIWAVGTTDDYDYPYRADGLTMHRVCSSGTPTPSPTGPTATRTRTATGTPSPTATPGGPPYCTQASFGPPANFAVGNSPERVAVGDFNRDGNPDIAVANGVSWNVSVLLGNGSGGFGPATNYDTTTEPAGIVVGDFNLDGTPDIAVGGYGTDRAMVMLGNGSGGFGPVTGYVVGSGPSGLATGDLNHDGKLDLVVSNGFDDTMSVLMGNGTGGFSGPTDYDLDWIPVDITLGDFNRDGHLDVAAANSFSDNVSVRLGTGTGAFGAMQLYDVAQNPRSIAVGDFNRDGNPDIATSSEDTGNMSILLGNGSGGFAAATNFPAGNGSASIGVADFSGDGILDLAAANIPGNVAVLLGNGNGGFGAVANFRAGSGPRAVAVGDFNRDGKPDMAVTNNTSNNVSVLLNTCTAIGVTPTGTPPTATNTPQATFTRTPAPPTGTSVPSSRTPTALATSVSTLTPGATTSPSPCAITFSDVRPTDYFYEAVRYLYCRGVISGYADNTFRPFNDTTRGQLSKIVVLARGWALDCPSAGHFSGQPLLLLRGDSIRPRYNIGLRGRHIPPRQQRDEGADK